MATSTSAGQEELLQSSLATNVVAVVGGMGWRLLPHCRLRAMLARLGPRPPSRFAMDLMAYSFYLLIVSF